jgi:uncharacterized YigZ family protein
MMADFFKTISLPVDGIYKEKGSKFLAFAYPVKSKNEIEVIIQKIKKDYADARHICFAWMLGAERLDFKVNDDGEPSGTAGRPVLGQINARELSNILVVVVRYFGGVLLGTGGLIQAYKEAASDALNKAEIVECQVYKSFKVIFGYQHQSLVLRILKEYETEIISRELTVDCTLFIRVPLKYASLLENAIQKIYGVNIFFDE